MVRGGRVTLPFSPGEDDTGIEKDEEKSEEKSEQEVEEVQQMHCWDWDNESSDSNQQAAAGGSSSEDPG